MNLTALLNLVSFLAGGTRTLIAAAMGVVAVALQMPALADEPAMRNWAGQLAVSLSVLASQSATEIDDRVVTALTAIVHSDEGWEIFYRLVVRTWTGPVDAAPLAAIVKVDIHAASAALDLVRSITQLHR